MVKRGLLLLSAISIFLIIIISGVASALNMMEDCANRGGWVYVKTSSMVYRGSVICSQGPGTSCLKAYLVNVASGVASDTRSCDDYDSSGDSRITHACCGTKVAAGVSISRSGMSNLCTCPSGLSFAPAPGCSYLNPVKASGGGCYGCGSWSSYSYYSWLCKCSSSCDYIGMRECKTGTTYPQGKQCTAFYDGGSNGACASWIDLAPCTASGQICWRGDCCTKKTCSSYSGKCGVQSDGCGGSTASCTCPSGQNCVSGNCCTPVNAVWSAWSEWTACLHNERNRTRTCSTASCSGVNLCTGSNIEKEECCSNECVVGGASSTYCDTADPLHKTLVTCNSVTINGLPCGVKTTSQCQYGCFNDECNACPASWTPLPSVNCTIFNVTQSDGCGQTRIVHGTKNCCMLSLASWNKTSLSYGTGDLVRMNVTGKNCSEGERVNFTIYNSTNSAILFLNTTVVNNKSVLEWNGNAISGTYYFNVTLDANASRKTKSGNLILSSSIVVVCGDNEAEGAEACDGSDLNGKTCTNLGKGYTGGTLKCYPATHASKCTFNETGCTSGATTYRCSDLTSSGSAICKAAGSEYIIGDPGYESGKDCICDWFGFCNISCISKVGDCSFRCVKTVKTEGVCDEATGTKSVELKAEIAPIGGTCPAGFTDPSCEGGNVEVPCGLVELDMPFFGWINFVAAAGLIVVIYCFVRKR